jgi:iron complex transport system substrate-binding protein
MRVVSLLPAATEIVAALGALGRLVGVSHECDFPPQVRSLPSVTGTTLDTSRPSREIDRAMAEAKRTGVSPVEVDLDLLAHLRPDVLLGQSVCEVCAVGEGELARIVTTLMPTPWLVTLHAHTLDEVFVDIRKVGEALELRDEAEELEAGLRYRLRQVENRARGSRSVGAQHAAPLPKPRVLVLEWLDPPYVAGHWVPELVALAGGQDVGSTPGEPSRPRPWEELAALTPDLVVVALCGFDAARARAEFAAVTERDAPAVLGRRVEFLDGNAYTSRPGPRLVDAAERLSRLIIG